MSYDYIQTTNPSTGHSGRDPTQIYPAKKECEQFDRQSKIKFSDRSIRWIAQPQVRGFLWPKVVQQDWPTGPTKWFS